MNERSKRFVGKIFWNYYSNAFREEEFLAGIPPRLEAREWGFIPIYLLPKIVMRRHISFQSPSEMKKFVLKNVPAHIYHSSAYYKYPGADKMEKKGWEGADLIFDIDGEIGRGGYSQMLLKAKEEAVKLKDFLMDDFGFVGREILTVFSGGRGYHVHVRDGSILKLGGAERREILDYLTANSLDVKNVLRTTAVRGDYGAKSGYFYEETNSGWGRRVWGYVISFLEYIKDLDEEDAIEKIRELKVGRKEKLVKNVSKEDAFKMLTSIKNEKIFDMARNGKIISKELGNLVERVVESSVEDLSIKGLSPSVDEPVTSDIKRLIRLPGSIHGGSGLIARMVDDLDDFDPLVDAVIFSEEEKKIISDRNMEVEMMDNTYKIKKGENKVPEFVVVFLICRGVAEYGC
ncbi:MAG: DNA primase small subunit PriS [Candidatus Methanolliviera sp. GoM_oil]|nr:MAG: DNA primase small subunit PriS [Candidatus Methanolliviera sp. GoM_oil]